MLAINKKFVSISILSVLLIAWEIFYLRGLIDPDRFSHPIGGLLMLSDARFVRGFGIMMLQLAFVSCIGGWLGFSIGRLIAHNARWSYATLYFLRIGMWLPFLVYWPLPIWPPRNGYYHDSIFWAWIGSIAAVILSTCYHYLLNHLWLGLQKGEAWRYIVKSTILQALFICLISQGWIFPHGWFWFPLPGQGSVAIVYASFGLIVAFLYLLELICQSTIDRLATTRGSALTGELGHFTGRSVIRLMILAMVSLVLWHIVAKSLGRFLSLSTPVEVLAVAYKMLMSGPSSLSTDSSIWIHIGVSLLEILGGLVLCGVISIIVFRVSFISNQLRRWVLSLLPFTFIAPILGQLIIMHWVGGFTGPWRVALGVSFLSFFTFLTVLYRSTEQPFLSRSFLALEEALPFAFVAMIVGEVMNATSGLGFYMVTAGRLSPDGVVRGLAASLMTVVLLIILSVTLRWVGRRKGEIVRRSGVHGQKK